MKVKVKIDGKIVEKNATIKPLGNFNQLIIKHQNRQYFIGSGDEYLRGLPEYFELDKRRIYK